MFAGAEVSVKSMLSEDLSFRFLNEQVKLNEIKKEKQRV